jgi:drug/metabolite transporter (DMT)-like permease
MTVLLAGVSALMYGVGDFCGGLATRRSPVVAVMVLSQLTGLCVAAAAALLLGQPVPPVADLLWGVAGGACGTLGLALLYTAIASTPVAVASPVAAVTGTVIPVLFGLALGDKPSTLAWAGIAAAFPAILLLSLGPGAAGRGGGARRGALMGAAAGVGFGLFFVAVSRTSPGSGLWPLVAARVCTISLTALYAAVRRVSLHPGRAGWPAIIASGGLDMLANIAFLLSSRAGMLTVSAVVTSLYPCPTVLCAMLFFRERLTPARAVGIALAVAGVALISV